MLWGWKGVGRDGAERGTEKEKRETAVRLFSAQETKKPFTSY